jgi:protein ImuB
LRARFGERLLLRIDQLLGTAQEMIVPHRPPPQFAEEWVLEFPAERREVVEQILRELVHRIAAALAARREGVLKLACRLDCAPGRPLIFEVGLFRPSADKEHLWDLVRMQLEQVALPGPVGRVRLEATLTARLENRQGELFAGGQHEAERQLALLIDRYSSRLGPSAVLRPELTADPLPEKAVRYRQGVGGQGTGAKKKFKVQGSRFKVSDVPTLNFESTCFAGARTLNSAFLRPLFLCTPPQPLNVLSIAPDGPPISIHMHGRQCEVAAREGPERIETGWWRGKTIRRDYWRVETTTGQRFWLFRALDNGKWCLHGQYE